jgi:hypothetical protein
MRLILTILFSASLILAAICAAQNSPSSPDQRNPGAANPIKDLKMVVVATEAKSDSEIVISPATSGFLAIVKLRDDKPAMNSDSNLPTWIRQVSGVNGLQTSDVQPWHIVVTYDQFDEDGDNVHSGTFEEYWAGPTKYKRTYKSDDFNQTDIATDHGLYRSGDQRWPDPVELQVRAEVIDPFSYAATLQGFHVRTIERSFSGYKLDCALIENESGFSDPTQYCFEPERSVLRYSRGYGWNQTTYNRIVSLTGHNVAQDVDVTNAGKPHLKLRVEIIESLSHVDDADFTPSSAAVGPIGGRISGVQPNVVKTSYAQMPASLHGQHVSVEVEFVVGKDGHVVSAHAVSGPKEAGKACEDAVRKTVFAPYFVLDKAVEVASKYTCTFQ